MKKGHRLQAFLKIIVSIILLQTLFFKFTGAPESIFIFSTLEMEPWGRIGSGIIELVAVILLFIPKTTWLGAAMTAGSMAGAIFFHITKLGIEVRDDGGLLFGLACFALVASLSILFIEYRKKKIPMSFLYRSTGS